MAFSPGSCVSTRSVFPSMPLTPRMSSLCAVPSVGESPKSLKEQLSSNGRFQRHGSPQAACLRLFLRTPSRERRDCPDREVFPEAVLSLEFLGAQQVTQ